MGDLGCGEGVLVADLLADRSIAQVVATDVSARALQIAARKLKLDRMSAPQRERIEIFQSSLTYRDDRLAGLDAAVLIEVIEHVDPPRLPAIEKAVFGHAAPSTVIVTTPMPNREMEQASVAFGAVAFMPKPFDTPDLNEALARARRVS